MIKDGGKKTNYTKQIIFMEWFADWFNSKYYHILYQNRNEKEAEQFYQCPSKVFQKRGKNSRYSLWKW